MTKYSDPEFKVVLTPAQDVLTTSDAFEAANGAGGAVSGFAGGASVTAGAPIGF